MVKQWLSLILGIVISSTIGAVELKIATEYPDGNSVLNELRQAGQRISEQTEGRVKLRFYPGGVMGDVESVKRKIRIGQLHGAFVHSGGLADAYKDSQVLNAPLLFRTFEEVDKVREAFDEEINQSFIDAGWQTFGLVEGGFAFAMTSGPATSLEDLKQQKIWLPANDPFSEKIARAFGINPIVLNIGDVLTALQTNAINAVVAPPVGAITLQWFSRVTHLTNAPFMYTYGVIALGERNLRGISSADRAVIEAEFTLASQNLDRQARIDNERAFEALQSLGLTIVELDEAELARIEQESARAIEQLIASGEMSRDLYTRVKALLDQSR